MYKKSQCFQFYDRRRWALAYSQRAWARLARSKFHECRGVGQRLYKQYDYTTLSITRELLVTMALSPYDSISIVSARYAQSKYAITIYIVNWKFTSENGMLFWTRRIANESIFCVIRNSMIRAAFTIFRNCIRRFSLGAVKQSNIGNPNVYTYGNLKHPLNVHIPETRLSTAIILREIKSRQQRLAWHSDAEIARIFLPVPPVSH